MDKLVPTLVVAAVLVVALLLIVWGWRRRVRRDRPAGGGYAARTDARGEAPAQPIATAESFYVATTKGGEHLERLALPGLSFRGKATVSVAADGVTIAVTGEQPVYIPVSAISGLGAATTAIDRVVEKDGLLRLSWTTSGGAAADSFFRVVDPADRAPIVGAVESILPAGSQAGTSTESEV
ncbi:hypothetical protein ASE16_09760 [Leifsonia sp. Root227]|uniref:PH-like domain-containing protein n=1 Tax=Leifsonia sp. Root227 TaxID=1736496 RepID=UPI0006F9EF2A|nr:hypothetical protein [Leifsonia sp. Root227]KRC51197.1 hypothetical protein ASE16_09760 [Leifsonia sp. Root227]